MSLTVLFVGGPEDGKLRAVTNPLNDIAVAELVDPHLAFYDADYDEPAAAIATRTTYYRPERIALFGKKADRPVFIHESVLDRKGEALAKHLLSPIGRSLVGFE